MEKLRPYFTLRDGSDRRGNSVVPHWIWFCSGFDSVAVCRQREGLPSIRANTTRAKPYAIALPRYAGLSHMEKLRPYFTLRDGSDRRGNSVVPLWIRL